MRVFLSIRERCGHLAEEKKSGNYSMQMLFKRYTVNVMLNHFSESLQTEADDKLTSLYSITLHVQ